MSKKIITIIIFIIIINIAIVTETAMGDGGW